MSHLSLFTEIQHINQNEIIFRKHTLIDFVKIESGQTLNYKEAHFLGNKSSGDFDIMKFKYAVSEQSELTNFSLIITTTE